MAEPQGGDNVSEKRHQRPWFKYGGNPNRTGAVQDQASSAWEREVARLTAYGIDPEELKVYALEPEYLCTNEKVNSMNEDIVVKLNTIGAHRRQWFLLKCHRGNDRILKRVQKQMETQRFLIIDVQRSIQNAGARYVPIPELFDRMPKV